MAELNTTSTALPCGEMYSVLASCYRTLFGCLSITKAYLFENLATIVYTPLVTLLCSLSRLHLAMYSKLFSHIIVLKIHLLALKTNTMTLLFNIEFVLVREVHNESNFTCISKAFDQTAFGPRQIFVFILLCLN